MVTRIFILCFLFIIFIARSVQAQDSLSFRPVVIEAEAGKQGSGFSTLKDGAVTYVTAKGNYAESGSPGDTIRMITYQVTLPDPGYYHVYARMRVGAGAFNDDSFFAGKGFGGKNETSANDWVMVNGLASAGFTNSYDMVNEPGTAGSNVWKWVNITQNFFPSTIAQQAFVVGSENQGQTFQIGSREDGLQFDKFAFGKVGLFFSVNALDKVLPGIENLPPTDSSKYYKGPALAKDSPKFLGNVKAWNDNNFANLWNQLTPENEGKWGSVASSIDSTRWNWTNLDNLYKYAQDNKMVFRNHTLIWGAQQPSWISSLAPAEQLKYIETWIRMTGKRYPKMEMLDVVNEPLPGHNPPDGTNNRANYKNALGGNGTTGWDWVIKSFELARKYIPNSKLLLNEFGIINDNNATNSYLKIINLLKDRGLIDGIGVQGHRFELENASVTTLKNNLDKLAATGLPIYITEFDLGNLNNAGTPNDQQQLQLYQRIFPVLWEHPGVKGITLWGYRQNMMWQETCHLVLTDGTWRPALKWLAQYIKDTPLEGNQIPASTLADFNLGQNHPNPFRESTQIRFSIDKLLYVSLTVYDVQGKKVEALVNEKLGEGNHIITWEQGQNNGKKMQSGVYFYRMIAGDHVITKKMLLID